MAERNVEIKFADGNAGFQIGQSFGPVNAEIHLPPGMLCPLLYAWLGTTKNADCDPALERAETPPLPSSNVPFRRDPDFVERGTLFDQLYEKLSEPAARVALAGLGGVGYGT